jgi:hypothetical protein
LLHAIVHSAGIQDRDGGILLLATLFGQFPFLETGQRLTSVLQKGRGKANIAARFGFIRRISGESIAALPLRFANDETKEMSETMPRRLGWHCDCACNWPPSRAAGGGHYQRSCR